MQIGGSIAFLNVLLYYLVIHKFYVIYLKCFDRQH